MPEFELWSQDGTGDRTLLFTFRSREAAELELAAREGQEPEELFWMAARVDSELGLTDAERVRLQPNQYFPVGSARGLAELLFGVVGDALDRCPRGSTAELDFEVSGLTFRVFDTAGGLARSRAVRLLTSFCKRQPVVPDFADLLPYSFADEAVGDHWEGEDGEAPDDDVKQKDEDSADDDLAEHDADDGDGELGAEDFGDDKDDPDPDDEETEDDSDGGDTALDSDDWDDDLDNDDGIDKTLCLLNGLACRLTIESFDQQGRWRLECSDGQILGLRTPTLFEGTEVRVELDREIASSGKFPLELIHVVASGMPMLFRNFQIRFNGELMEAD